MQTYRTVVSHENVPPWKEHSIRSIGYHSHLYTRLAAGQETDEIEKWLEHDFETPAAEPIKLALADDRLTRSHWKILARFVAAQHIRTPAWFLKQFPRWKHEIPNLTNQVLEDVKTLAASAALRGHEDTKPFPNTKYLPIRVVQTNEPDTVQLRLDVAIGRGFWLFAIKHVLTSTLNVLLQHRWTILKSPPGLQFFTSDNPSICLNFHRNGAFDFEGGWGSPKTEIMLPLGPGHMLYAQVGNQHPPRRGTAMEPAHAHPVRQVIANHAHRMIFAAAPDGDIAALRPRIVSAELYKAENEAWEQWHLQQLSVERNLLSPP